MKEAASPTQSPRGLWHTSSLSLLRLGLAGAEGQSRTAAKAMIAYLKNVEFIGDMCVNVSVVEWARFAEDETTSSEGWLLILRIYHRLFLPWN